MLSIITGYVGLNVGGIFGADIFSYLFGIVGVLSPAMFVLNKLYDSNKINNINDSDVTSTLVTLKSIGILTNDEYKRSLCDLQLADENLEAQKKYDRCVALLLDLFQRKIILVNEFNEKTRLLKLIYKQ